LLVMLKEMRSAGLGYNAELPYARGFGKSVVNEICRM